MYTFRFNVIENITRTSVSINRAFGSMRFQARQFALGIGDGWRQALRLERESERLEQANRRAFDTASVSRFGRGIGGVTNMVGRLRTMLATLGIGLLLNQAATYNDRLFTANAMVAGITRSTQGLATAQRTALALSDQTGISYLNSMEGISKMLTITKGNVQEAGNLTRVAQALAATNPAEGFEGALFALKEIEGGDTMSLRERFNIRVPTAEEAKKIAARDGRTVQQVMLDSLQGYLDSTYGGGQAGQGVEFLLNIRANTIGGQMQRIANSFQNIFTPMLLPFLQRLTGFLKGVGDWVQANKSGIQQVFGGVLSFLDSVFSSAQNMFIQLFPIMQASFGQVVGFIRSIWPIVQGVVGNVVATLQSVFPYIQSLSGSFLQALGGVLPVIGSIIGAVLNLVKAIIPPVVFVGRIVLAVIRPVLILVGRLVSVLINDIADSINSIQQSIIGIGQDIYNAVAFIGQLAVWAWENHPFRWIIDLVDRVFPGFKSALGGLWDWVKGLFSSLVDWIWNNVIKPIGGWITSILESLGLVNPSIKPGQPATAPALQASEPDNDGLFKQIGLSPAPLGGGNPEARGGSGLGVNKAIDNAVAGGREAIKNITINIGKQIESLTFQTTNLAQSKDVIRMELERLLLDVANDFNYAK